MVNWKGKTIEVDFSFLEEGEYNAVLAVGWCECRSLPFRLHDYKQTINKNSRINFTMAKGGGFVVVLEKK